MPYAGEFLIAGGAWRNYPSGGSTVLTAATTDPTQGNSTYTAQYRIVDTHLIKVRMRLTVGSTFSAGSGAYRFMAPPGYTMDGASAGVLMGVAHLRDSGVTIRLGTVYADNPAYVIVYFNSGAATADILTSTGPGSAWATNDYMALKWEFTPV